MNNRRSFLGGLAGIFGVGAVDAASKSAMATSPDVRPAPVRLPDWMPNLGEVCYDTVSNVVAQAGAILLNQDGTIDVLLKKDIQDDASVRIWWRKLSEVNRLNDTGLISSGH